jgi:opacity protein-like surface antigen
MKLTLLTTSIALLTLSLSAYAGTDTKEMKQIAPAAQCPSDDGFYVGLFGGANFSQDNGNGRSEYTGPGTSNTVVTHSQKSDDLGGAGGIKLGYKFQSTDVGGGFALQPAVELEAFYLGTSLDLHDTQGTSNFGQTATTSSANLNSAAFFANGILNIKTPWHVTPYFGAGVGTEYMSISDKTLDNHIFTQDAGGFHTPTLHSSYSDDAMAFAVQAIAGVNYDLTSHWTLFTEYKFVAAIDPSFTYNNVYVAGDKLKYNPDFIGQHLVTAGVKYNF